MAEKGQFSFEGTVEAEDIHQNTKQSIMVITEDKMRLLLHKYRDSLEGNLFWLTPLGITLSLFITNLTAESSDKFGLSQEMWAALFLICNIGFGIWTAICLYNRTKRMSYDELISEIKNSENT